MCRWGCQRSRRPLYATSVTAMPPVTWACQARERRRRRQAARRRSTASCRDSFRCWMVRVTIAGASSRAAAWYTQSRSSWARRRPQRGHSLLLQLSVLTHTSLVSSSCMIAGAWQHWASLFARRRLGWGVSRSVWLSSWSAWSTRAAIRSRRWWCHARCTWACQGVSDVRGRFSAMRVGRWSVVYMGPLRGPIK